MNTLLTIPGRIVRTTGRLFLELAYVTRLKKAPKYEPLTMEYMQTLQTSNRGFSARSQESTGAELFQTAGRMH